MHKRLELHHDAGKTGRIDVKAEADAHAYRFACTTVRCSANPATRGHMARPISDFHAEAEVLRTHAPKFRLSVSLSLQDANAFDEALELIDGDPHVIIGAAEA